MSKLLVILFLIKLMAREDIFHYMSIFLTRLIEFKFSNQPENLNQQALNGYKNSQKRKVYVLPVPY